MLRLWRRRPFLTSGFVLATALTLFFAARLLWSVIYWANPAHQNEAIKPWMTVGYVARSWNLEGPAIDALANLPGPQVKGHPQPLREIARDRGVPVAQVIAEVEAAIAVLKQAEPQP
jgi:hypothetical protein